MDLHVHGRNLEISTQTQEHIESKLEPINRHLPGISDATVELVYEPTRSSNDRIMAQVTLNVGGRLLRAQQRAPNTEAAVNSVTKALDQQIKRYKSHTYRSQRRRQTVRGGGAEPEAWETNGAIPVGDSQGGLDEADSAYFDGQVVRVKQFEMEPMSVDEAAVRMQFLGHSFYMFLDSESGKHGVLYLRGDGNYGLIQPKTV